MSGSKRSLGQMQSTEAREKRQSTAAEASREVLGGGRIVRGRERRQDPARTLGQVLNTLSIPLLAAIGILLPSPTFLDTANPPRPS
eukprot:203870-Rhodomonas_salina.1